MSSGQRLFNDEWFLEKSARSISEVEIRSDKKWDKSPSHGK